MSNDQLQKKILTLLKQYTKASELNALLQNLRKATAAERKLLGTAPRAAIERSVADRGSLDQIITFCEMKLKQCDAARVVLGIGDIYRDQGELLLAGEMYSHAIVQSEHGREPSLAGEAYLRRGDLHSRQGLWKSSADDLNESRRWYRKANDRTGLARVDNITGTNHAIRGNLTKAQACYTKSLAAFEESDDPLMTGTLLMNLGIVNNILGAHDEALSIYRRAEPHFARVGSLQRLMELHHNIGMSHFCKEQFKEAMRHFDTSAKFATRLQDVNMLATACLGKSSASCRMKDYKLALAFVNQAVRSFTVCNNKVGIADSYKVKGMILRDMRQFSVAMSLFQTSLRINGELDNELNSGETHFEIGVLERMRGNRSEAALAFDRALKHFTNVGARKDMQRTGEELARLVNRTTASKRNTRAAA